MYLEKILSPRDLKKINQADLPKLAAEIREKILEVTSEKGGHIASSLGAVELAIAVHYVLDAPSDRILWDIGHQAYAHKLLTGRRDSFKTIRELGGISGFLNKNESPYDIFTVGHASTSVSSALGLASARDLSGGKEKVLVVIGDAAMANGMAFEALNHMGHLKKDVIVILNDNELSISKTVGALSKYLNNILVNPVYNKVHGDLAKLIKKIPRFGFSAYRAARKFEEGVKNLLVPGVFFEKLGFRYIGPIDGHSTDDVINKLRQIVKLKGPVLLHAVTRKGKGYKYSEENPSLFHGSGPFNRENGRSSVSVGKKKTFTEGFSEKIVELGSRRKNVVAVTAAMLDGTGLDKFALKYPNRVFDVGIAEGHAVTFSAALAKGGYKPFLAIYSTFLQRGYDQIIHDVCLQDLGVVFCLDRAGLVGEDGATHNGVFDIAYMRHIPHMIVSAPKDIQELKDLMDLAAVTDGPFSIRYPRGGELTESRSAGMRKNLEVGKFEVLKEGRHLAILAIGSMVGVSLEASRLLDKRGVHAAVINARFIKPLDKEMLEDLAKRYKRFVTVEEGVISGGFGSAILEFMDQENIRDINLKLIGLPCEFIEHGRREELLRKYNLTPEGIADIIQESFHFGGF